MDKLGQSLFLKVAKSNKELIVRELLKKEGIDVNKKDNDGKSPFMHACEEGHIKIAKLLFEIPCFIEDTDNHNRNALMYVPASTLISYFYNCFSF